jgi:fibronectin type 3 domain-containing protein
VLLAVGAAGPVAADACAPTGFQADPVGSVVHLHWDDTTGATSYDIYRAEGDGAFMLAILMQAPANETYDTQVESGLTYRYMATAVADGVETAPCGTVQVTVGGECAPTLTVAYGGDHNDLTWTFNRVADSYNVYRSVGRSGHFRLLANVVNDNTYTDADLNPHLAYHYQVRAVVHGSVERPPCNTV